MAKRPRNAVELGTHLATAGSVVAGGITAASALTTGQAVASKAAQRIAARGSPAAPVVAKAATSAPMAALGRLASNASVVKAAKLSLPLLLARATYGAVTGYQRDGVKGAAMGLVDAATMGQATSVAANFTSAGPGNAYLNAAAADKAKADDKEAAKPPPAPSAAATPAGKQPASRSGYTTKDGRTVEATQAQAQAYQSRIK